MRRITETGPENVSIHRNEKKKLSRKNVGLDILKDQNLFYQDKKH